MRCSVLTRSLLPRMRRGEGGTSIRSIVHLTPTRQATGYLRSSPNSSSALPAPGEQGHHMADVLGNERVGTRKESTRGAVHWVERGGDSWKERKVWASGFLELGFHNNASYSFSLGRPHLCELETETVTIHPPHHGPINTHWPLLVVKEQGQAERRADLHLGKTSPDTRPWRDRGLSPRPRSHPLQKRIDGNSG